MGQQIQRSLFSQTQDENAGKCLGITVSGGKVTYVLLDLNGGMPAKVVLDETFTLAEGDRPSAYHDMFRRVRDLIQERDLDDVVIKDSAVPRASVSRSHLLSAELRGVVKGAARAGGATVYSEQKSTVSRSFGDRKTDEYVDSESFWNDAISGDLRKGSRETALLIFYSFE